MKVYVLIEYNDKPDLQDIGVFTTKQKAKEDILQYYPDLVFKEFGNDTMIYFTDGEELGEIRELEAV